MDNKKVRIPLELPEELKNSFIKKLESIYPKMGLNPALRLIIHVLLNISADSLKTLLEKGVFLETKYERAESPQEYLDIFVGDDDSLTEIVLQTGDTEKKEIKDKGDSAKSLTYDQLQKQISDLSERLKKIEKKDKAR